MSKKIFKILFGVILFASFIVGFARTSYAGTVTVIATDTCRTGGSISSSPCGSDSCPAACDNVGGGSCWDEVRGGLSSWNYYIVGQAKTWKIYSYGGSWYYYYYSEQNASVKVCSTADKMCGEYSYSCPATSQLWNGTCTCGIGNQYKVCCQLADPGAPETTTRTPIKSTKSYEQDDYAPYEAGCPSDNKYIHQGSAYETVFSASCPNPPTINIAVNGTAVTNGGTVKANIGESMKISWDAKTGADSCTSNITGAGNTGAGSYNYVPFPNSVPQNTAGADLWINCVNNYRGYSRYSASDLKTVAVVNDFHFHFVSGTPTCPVILTKDAAHTKCADYNVVPKDASGNQTYQQINKSYVNADTSRYAPVAADQLCCQRPTCEKCSTDKPGKFATWLADMANPVGDCAAGDWSTVNYTPVTGDDPRCALNCRINNWKIDPTSITKGGKVSVSWSAAAADSSKDPLVKCEMTQNGANKTSEQFVTTDKQYGPLNATTQFDLTCTTQKGNTCSAGGPALASSGGGMVPISCTVNSFAPSSGSYTTQSSSVDLSWTTTDAGTCNINGTTVNKNDSKTFSISDGDNSFKLSCTSQSSPSSTCEKTITISKVSNNVVYYGGNALNVSVTPNDYCYPNSGDTSNTRNTIRYASSAINTCSSIIGGGNESNTNISCSATKGDAAWRAGVSGASGNVSSPSINTTTTYGTSCQRSQYTCTRSDLTYDESSQCDSSANTWKAKQEVASASCSSYCDASSFKTVSDTSSCVGCTSCTQQEPYSCSYSCDCKTTTTGTPPVTTTTCSTCWKTCYRCVQWNCATDLDYRLTITSKSVVTDPRTAENYVKYIQKPETPSIYLGGNIQSKGTYYQILLNQFFDILITLTAPTSSNADLAVTTKIICNASVKAGGDSTAWNKSNMTLVTQEGAINKIKASVRDNWKTLFGLTNYYSPTRSTIYQLFCKNQENSDNACYNNGDQNGTVEVKVYTPDLQERGPSAFDNMKSFFGNILFGIKK